MPARPSRRTVVAAAVALPVVSAAGCTLSGPTPQRRPVEGSTGHDPDVALLHRVADATETMVALYEAVLRRHRSLRRDLRPLLATHRAHAAALGDAAPSGRVSPDGPRRRGRTPSPQSMAVPRRPRQALLRVRAAERKAAEELLGATRRAASGPFARLLASMSAASSQHVRVLAQVGGR